MTRLLEALERQRYPQDRLQIIVVVHPARKQLWQPIGAQYESVLAVEGDPDLHYYQQRAQGVAVAEGEIIALLDPDNFVDKYWLEKIVAPFLDKKRIGAVHGKMRFRDTFFSPMVGAFWWADENFSRGRISRILAPNNLAFRGDLLRSNFFDDPSQHRGVWERAMSNLIHERGQWIWLTPGAGFTHDFEGGLGYFFHRALARGYLLMAVRAKLPVSRERDYGRWRKLVPILSFPVFFIKDAWRVITRAGSGKPVTFYWRLPVYLLFLIPFEIVQAVGMFLATTDYPEIEPP